MITILVSAEAYVIPVEVSQTPWHYTTFWDWLDHWQTGLAGAGAVIAAFLTIWVTRRIANRQIAASREDANRVVAAASAQTEATFKQTDATVTLDQLHDASEALAFHAMLAVAMDRVRAEAAWARKTYPLTLAADDRLVGRGPCCSSVHHQGRVC